MKEFMGKDFLIDNEVGLKLYEGYAAKAPIFDFHCHLNPQEIYEDKKFRSLTEVWLGGDHYKWRLMREAGVDEKYITGDAEDYEKFLKYAEIMPYCIGNPLYLWTHLELRRYFGIYDILSPETAEKIYKEANEKLRTLSARKMIVNNNVRTIFTTDDPVDDLRWHILLKQDKDFEVRVSPAFRPDKALNIEREGFSEYIEKLGKVCGYKISGIDELSRALVERTEYFDKNGCCCSDHALDVVMYEKATREEADAILKKALAKEAVTRCEIEKYKGYVLTELGRLYRKYDWVQQYHIGALRNNSERYMKLLGPDTGFDSVNDGLIAEKLSALLNALDRENNLPKTILYCLNPRDNEVLATIMNCFQQSGYDGKIQFGSGWWFNDQKDGMERQTETLSQMALLSKFVGMLTDSRSFLSYTRHEFFRRILCNKLGAIIERGEYPADIEFVGKIVEDICYNNAVRYFSKKN